MDDDVFDRVFNNLSAEPLSGSTSMGLAKKDNSKSGHRSFRRRTDYESAKLASIRIHAKA